jgi:hypothetical protein
MPDMEAELAAAQEAYLANVSYAREGSATMAYAFAEACRKLLMLIPAMTSQGSRHVLDMRRNLDAYAKGADEAEIFAASGTTGSVRHFDVSGFRD